MSHHRLAEHSVALEPQCTHLGKLIPLLQLPGATSCCFCLLHSEKDNRAGEGLQSLTVQGDICQGKKQVDFKSIMMHLTKLREQEERTTTKETPHGKLDLIWKLLIFETIKADPLNTICIESLLRAKPHFKGLHLERALPN